MLWEEKGRLFVSKCHGNINVALRVLCLHACKNKCVFNHPSVSKLLAEVSGSFG